MKSARLISRTAALVVGGALLASGCQFHANPLDANTANGLVSSWLLCQVLRSAQSCLGSSSRASLSQLSTDVNGDGYPDRLIAGYGNQGGGAADKGAAYIFYGGPGGVTLHPASATPYTCSGPPDCTVIQNPENEGTGRFGQHIGALGDVNGDGFADLVVGAMNNQGAGAADKGAVYVYYGSAAGITSHPLSATPYTCGGPPDCTVIQNPDNESMGGFGIGAATAGDVNGDGYFDMIIGAFGNQGAGAADKGVAYIFYGSPAGITSHPLSATPYACSGPPDCTVIQNPQNTGSGQFGFSVSSAGDVNRDGLADVIVGAWGNAGGGGAASKGVAYVFYGSASGITSHPTSASPYTCSGPPDCTEFQNPENEASGQLGHSVSSAGDVNRDGYADVIAGARLNQGVGAANKGSAYVFYGSATGMTSHPPSAAAYACSGPPDCTVIQNPENQIGALFGYAVSSAGDVNSDGFSDALVGAYLNMGAGANGKGAAYVFYGSASGITSHPFSAASYACSGPPDCTVMQNPDNETTGVFGQSVAPAGDMNRDGFADIVVGARNNQGAGANNKGLAYIFYGSASGMTSHPLSAATYTCSGPPDCSAIQNPENEILGEFGYFVASAEIEIRELLENLSKRLETALDLLEA
ncbi:MAG: VCBS repeat-containing protein [Leptospirales bacterium]|nr:VCBS repeat-containing protein [Leptospirales bacterium]